MAANEWLNNIMQADQQARGLSGGKNAGLVLDESNPYYNYRLKRVASGGDLVQDPSLLWKSPHGGLGPHVEGARGEGVAGFTDALIILSHEDYSRTAEKRDWTQESTRILLQHFEDFCRREGFTRRYAHRQLGFRFLCDGSADMGGQSLGLGRGEYVTGLVPNLYTGPVRGSYPVVGVHVNLPGIWESYQEVGHLFNDQVVFTIGNHWLDSFHHPSLGDGAVYRLQQDPDGNFMHVVNPDLSDRYQVTSVEQDGANVLTLSRRDGTPLAYMVLAVMEAPEAEPEPVPTHGLGGGGSLAEAPGTIPPPSMQEDEEPETVRMAARPRPKSKTIIPDAVQGKIFTLTERGAMLQKVHFGAFMLGYDVYVSDRGELGTAIEAPAATVQVRKRFVSVVSHTPGVTVGGYQVAPGVETMLEDDTEIVINGEKLEYHHLRGMDVPGWPYVGEIRRAASSTYLGWGESYKLGRSRECRVPLPDEPSNDNIQWKPEVLESTTIGSRSGPIPKAQFYTDSIMVSSQHAELDLKDDAPKVQILARNCYGYIRRGGEILPLYPASSEKGDSEATLQPGDELLVGNCSFKVSFDTGQAAEGVPEQAPDDAPPPPMLWEDAVAEREEEAPPAHGLGEEGPAPEPVQFTAAPDSILGMPDGGDLSTTSPLDAFEADSGEWDADPDSVSIAAMEMGEFDDFDDDSEEEHTEPESDIDMPSVDGFSAPRDLAPLDELVEPQRVVPPPFPDVDQLTSPEPADAESIRDEDTDHGDKAEALEAATEALPSFEGRPLTELGTVSDPLGLAPEPPTSRPVAAHTQDLPPEAAPRSSGTVVEVDDATAQFELGRPVQLVHVGWMIKGTMVAGNHTGADLIIPESRLTEEQSFEAKDYFELTVRGRRQSLTILDAAEVLIDEDDAKQATYEDLGEMVIDVIRRDEYGEEDFGVRVGMLDDRSLPDPRARLLAIDAAEPLTAALLSRGLPTRAPRTLTLQGVTFTMLNDGDSTEISDYLDTYRDGAGFKPFFVQHGDQRFTTMPEDGSAVTVQTGDRLVIGNAVYTIARS